MDWLRHYPPSVPKVIPVLKNHSLAGLIDETCNRYSNRPALTCMGRTLTFSEYEKTANNLACFFQKKLLLKKGDRIAIQLPNLLQFPIAFYAAQKAGLITVNTNPLYTPREMLHQFKDSGCKAIVIVDIFLKKLEEIISDTEIKHVIATSVGDLQPFIKKNIIKALIQFKGLKPSHGLNVYHFEEALNSGSELTLDSVSMDQNDVALLQYTGGTTGVSKGAMLTHLNILSQVSQIQAWVKPALTEGQECILTALPLYHIFALSINYLCFFSIGGEIVLVPKPIPIENTIKILKKYRITILTGVNTLFNALINHPKFINAPPKNLKVALGGGTATQEAVSKRWKELTGLPILEAFGLTEASPGTHANPLLGPIITGSIGIPIPSTDARIVTDDGLDVPIGEKGELIVRGPQVMKGYWQKPDETKKVIKDGWLWTGDIAKRDEKGYFYIVDRKKDMILVSGFNVYPNEVEEILINHPKVLEAAVVGVPDDKCGEAVKAFIVPKETGLTEDELKAHCKISLTNYKLPKYYEFRKELPKSNVGKILRRELR